MTTAVDNWPAYAWLWTVATAGQLSTAPTPRPGAQPHGHVVHRRTEPGRPVEPGDDAGEKASPRIGPILMHVGSSAGMTVIGRGTNVLVASEGW